MNDQQQLPGKITKIVRIPAASDSSWSALPSEFVGYGILRSPTGQEVFFAGAVVANGCFDLLDVGDEVHFTLEPGPLSRAARVWGPLKNHQRQSLQLFRSAE